MESYQNSSRYAKSKFSQVKDQVIIWICLQMKYCSSASSFWKVDLIRFLHLAECYFSNETPFSSIFHPFSFRYRHQKWWSSRRQSSSGLSSVSQRCLDGSTSGCLCTFETHVSCHPFVFAWEVAFHLSCHPLQKCLTSIVRLISRTFASRVKFSWFLWYRKMAVLLL